MRRVGVYRGPLRLQKMYATSKLLNSRKYKIRLTESADTHEKFRRDIWPVIHIRGRELGVHDDLISAPFDSESRNVVAD